MKHWKNIALIFLAGLLAAAGITLMRRSEQLAQQETRIQDLEHQLSVQAEKFAQVTEQFKKEKAAAEEREHSLQTAQETTLAAQRKAENKSSRKEEQQHVAAALNTAQSFADSIDQWIADANNPDVLRRLNMQAQNKIHQHYDELFNELNLSPDQKDKLFQLLVEKRQAGLDVAVASIQQGIDPRTNLAEFNQAVAKSKSGIEEEIQSLLGDTQYDQYQAFDLTTGQMNVVKNLQSALTGTGATLTPDQTKQFLQILDQNEAGRVTAKVIADSQDILSPVQLKALQDMRAIQRANSLKRNLPGQVLPTTPSPLPQK
jgi:hypothetical protein